MSYGLQHLFYINPSEWYFVGWFIGLYVFAFLHSFLFYKNFKGNKDPYILLILMPGVIMLIGDLQTMYAVTSDEWIFFFIIGGFFSAYYLITILDILTLIDKFSK